MNPLLAEIIKAGTGTLVDLIFRFVDRGDPEALRRLKEVLPEESVLELNELRSREAERQARESANG